MRALLIEALGNNDFTFDQLNYDLYALNKELFNQLNKETTAFFKFLAIKRPDINIRWSFKLIIHHGTLQQSRSRLTAYRCFHHTRLQKNLCKKSLFKASLITILLLTL